MAGAQFADFQVGEFAGFGAAGSRRGLQAQPRSPAGDDRQQGLTLYRRTP